MGERIERRNLHRRKNNLDTTAHCSPPGIGWRSHYQNVTAYKVSIFPVWRRKKKLLGTDLFVIGVESRKEKIFKPIIPHSLRATVFNQFHSIVHQGRQRTLSTIDGHYFWPGMTRDIVEWVKKEKDLFSCSHVWVRNEAPSHSLARLHVGPYLVLDRHEKYFVIATKSGAAKISIDRLKTAYLRPDNYFPPDFGLSTAETLSHSGDERRTDNSDEQDTTETTNEEADSTPHDNGTRTNHDAPQHGYILRQRGNHRTLYS